YTGKDLWTVGEAAVADDVPERANRAGLRLPRPEDQRADAREDERPGALGARLDRDDQRAAVPPPVAAGRGRPPQRQDLGVSGRVADGLALVVCGGQLDPVRVEDDGPDRHVVAGATRDLQGAPHPALVDQAELPWSRCSAP